MEWETFEGKIPNGFGPVVDVEMKDGQKHFGITTTRTVGMFFKTDDNLVLEFKDIRYIKKNEFTP